MGLLITPRYYSATLICPYFETANWSLEFGISLFCLFSGTHVVESGIIVRPLAQPTANLVP